MKHVVHLICSNFFGGPERQIIGLCSSLSSDYRNSIIVFSELGKCRGLQTEALKNGIECHIISDDLLGMLHLTHQLQRMNASINPDILCCHGYKANLIGGIVAKSMNLPFLVVLRGWTGENLKVKIYESIDKILLGKNNFVICLSEAQTQDVTRLGISPAKIRLIPNAINLDRFPVQSTKPVRLRQLLSHESKLICCSAGRLSPEKGFIDLLYVVEVMKGKKLPICFVLFGEGPLHKRLQSIIVQKNLSDYITLRGFSSDLDQIMPCCDILAIPSYTEGIPNVLLEGLASGLAVVATDVGGIPDLIVDGRNGFLVQPGDVQTMCSKIEALVNNKSLRLHFGSVGRSLVENKYSFDQQAERYKSVFREFF